MQGELDINATKESSPTWNFQCVRELENAKQARIDEIGETAYNEETQSEWFAHLFTSSSLYHRVHLMVHAQLFTILIFSSLLHHAHFINLF
jgi:hypothetical protein